MPSGDALREKSATSTSPTRSSATGRSTSSTSRAGSRTSSSCGRSPSSARFLERLASFSRLILFDKRGTGMSDRVSHDRLPTLEQRMDDVRAVLDAVGSERAPHCSGTRKAAACRVLFAATYPERTRRARPCRRIRETPLEPTTIRGRPRPRSGSRTIEAVERDWGAGLDITDYRAARGSTAFCASAYSTYLRAERKPRRRGRTPAHELADRHARTSFRPSAFRRSSCTRPATGTSRSTKAAGSRRRSPVRASSSSPAMSTPLGGRPGRPCSTRSRSS